MSRRPGIGKEWYKKYSSDVYPSDEVIMRGKQIKPPKFYDTQLSVADPKMYAMVKKYRVDSAKLLQINESVHRLAVKEEAQNLRFKQLKRGYENETQNVRCL